MKHPFLINRSHIKIFHLLTALVGPLAYGGSARIIKSTFGKTTAGENVSRYVCTNKTGASMTLLTQGARLQELKVPDTNGQFANVTLGLASPAAYEKHNAHFGGTVGRYANRIAGGKFSLDVKPYTLATNNGVNHLHGGIKGFDSVLWQSRELRQPDAVGVEFKYRSKDGEEGYPGNVDVTVSYLLNDRNELAIEYSATTDQTTVINLTNHAYWNLGGAGSGDVLGHLLTLEADKYLPIDKTSIPTGELKAVKGTAMDFTSPHTIGSRIGELKKDPEGTRGYDHSYVLRHPAGQLALSARVKEPKSGRVMEVWTTEPGLQLYVGNFLDGTAINGGFSQHAAFCLEAQHYPDSPNRPDFPTTVLNPGQTYRQTTVHKFFAEK